MQAWGDSASAGEGSWWSPGPAAGVVQVPGRLIALTSRVEKLGKTGDADLGSLGGGCEVPNFESLRN